MREAVVPLLGLVVACFLQTVPLAAQDPPAEADAAEAETEAPLSPDEVRERAFQALQAGDLPTAATMLEELGESGSPQGYTMLGEMKRDLGDYPDAARWFERGAEGGDVTAMVQGAEVLSDPKYGITDARRAYRMWLKAAERGIARGQYEAGRALMTGQGVRVDDEEGADWIEQAARQCYGQAQLAYALALREGRGREANGEEAFSWVIAAQRARENWSEEDLQRLAKLEQEITAYMSSGQVSNAYCRGLDLLAESCGGGGTLLALERWIACRG